MNGFHGPLALVAAVLGLTAWTADSWPPADVAKLAEDIAAERDHISAPDLADRIMRADPSLRVFDLRSAAEFAQFHIPGAQRVADDDLARAPLPRESTIVLYSEGGGHAAQAWVLLRMRGFRNVLFLREGIYEWVSRVHEPRLAVDATPAERAEFERAARMSRFFGGIPKADVPRSEVPAGYWTESVSSGAVSGSSKQTIAAIRRRGC
jgi:rhodanese-related sulfurtransferase